MKYILVLLDGIQDKAYDELDGKTPLDAGKGEGFARIFRESASVRFATTPPGMEPDTLNCTLTLLGLTPDMIPGGRTFLEALAENIPFEKDDLILRCNFVKVEDGILTDPCCNIPDSLAQTLIDKVKSRHGCFIKKIGDYKCLQILPRQKAFYNGIKTHPPHNRKGLPFTEALPSGNALADALAASSMSLLKDYSPYTVLHWGHSVYEALPDFTKLTGLSGGVVSKTLVVDGLALAMGMTYKSVPGATGDVDTNLAVKAEAALELLSGHDCAVLHIGGTDEATHRQNPTEKAEFIRRLDRELLVPILDRCPDGCKIMFTCDHEAYCSTAGHTTNPVVAWLWEKGRIHGGDLGLRDATGAIPLLCGGEWA